MLISGKRCGTMLILFTADCMMRWDVLLDISYHTPTLWAVIEWVDFSYLRHGSLGSMRDLQVRDCEFELLAGLNLLQHCACGQDLHRHSANHRLWATGGQGPPYLQLQCQKLHPLRYCSLAPPPQIQRFQIVLPWNTGYIPRQSRTLIGQNELPMWYDCVVYSLSLGENGYPVLDRDSWCERLVRSAIIGSRDCMLPGELKTFSEWTGPMSG